MAKYPFSLLFSSAASLLMAGTRWAQTKAPASQPPPQNQIQVPTGPPDPAKAPVIEELFSLTRPDKQMSAMLEQYKAAFSNAAQQGFVSEVRKFDDPSKYQNSFEKLQTKLFAIMQSRLEWSQLKPQFVKAYSDTFTKDELSGMVAFYKSPAGQAEVQKMPKLLAVSGAIGQSHMQPAIPEMQKVMTDYINELRAKAQSSKPAGTTPAPQK